MGEPFARSPEDVRKAMVMTGSRLTAATQNRDNALAAARKADDEVLTFERHIAMCQRSLDGLLDEYNAAMDAAMRETVDAGS